MKYVPECEALAPYLKEKLRKDPNHTWRDAPYIHEEVRAAIVQSEYQLYEPAVYYDALLLHKLEKQRQTISTADYYATMINQANTNTITSINSNYSAIQNANIR